MPLSNLFPSLRTCLALSRPSLSELARIETVADMSVATHILVVYDVFRVFNDSVLVRVGETVSVTYHHIFIPAQTHA